MINIKLENPNKPANAFNRYICYDLAFEDRQALRELKFKYDDKIKKWWTDDWLKVLKAEAKLTANTLKSKVLAEMMQESSASQPKINIKDTPLKPYQQAGVEYILKRENVILADEPGLGKTMQAIASMFYHDKVGQKKAVVICPATIKENWVNELTFFCENYFKSVIVTKGTQKFVDQLLKDDQNNLLIIVNYDFLKNKFIADQLKKFDPDYLVLDEAHYLKNLKSKRYLALAHTILPNWLNLKLRILLTGTPIQNRPKEVFPLVKLTKPETLSPYQDFRKFATHYCNGHYGKWGFEADGSSNEAELRERLIYGGVLIRRTKEQVLPQLPDKSYNLLTFEGDTRAKNLVKKMNENFTFEQIMSSPTFWAKADKNLATQRRELALCKLPQSLEQINELLESVDKMVVFAWHTEVINELEKQLAIYNPALISGKTRQETRQAQVEKFQNDKTCRVFIGNILAAGVGITLTAASHVDFVETSWVPGEIFQAVDRCHRIGQKNSVNARFHVVENSIDEAVIRSLISKNITIKKII